MFATLMPPRKRRHSTEVSIDASTLRIRRGAAGYTQGELAYHAGVDQSQISKIERGAQIDVALSTARRLARALGLTLDELVGNVNVMDPEMSLMLKEVGRDLTPEELEGIKPFLRRALERKRLREQAIEEQRGL